MDETWLGQIRKDGVWLDYARGTEESSRAWQAKDPANHRVVDWIDKGKILVPSTEIVFIREARRWVVDAGFFTEAEARHMGGPRLIRVVDNQYEGGWDAFKEDNKALLSE